MLLLLFYDRHHFAIENCFLFFIEIEKNQNFIMQFLTKHILNISLSVVPLHRTFVVLSLFCVITIEMKMKFFFLYKTFVNGEN